LLSAYVLRMYSVTHQPKSNSHSRKPFQPKRYQNHQNLYLGYVKSPSPRAKRLKKGFSKFLSEISSPKRILCFFVFMVEVISNKFVQKATYSCEKSRLSEPSSVREIKDKIECKPIISLFFFSLVIRVVAKSKYRKRTIEEYVPTRERGNIRGIFGKIQFPNKSDCSDSFGNSIKLSSCVTRISSGIQLSLSAEIRQRHFNNANPIFPTKYYSCLSLLLGSFYKLSSEASCKPIAYSTCLSRSCNNIHSCGKCEDIFPNSRLLVLHNWRNRNNNCCNRPIRHFWSFTTFHCQVVGWIDRND
jgi:hypothetical protein